MRGRPKRLQVRLSLLFVALLLGVSGADAWLLLGPANADAAEEIQRRNHGLAASVAPALRPDGQTNTLGEAALRQTFGAAAGGNPLDWRYLVGLDGRILRPAAPPGEVRLARVSTAPIQAFLGPRAALPIWGTDPRQPGTPSLFSAALLRTRAGVPYGYLYITLGWHLATDELAAPRPRQYYLRRLLGTLALAVVSVLVVGLLLIALLTRNLHRLSAAVRGLQRAGYATRVVGIRPGDELGELAAAFNDMAARTQQAVQALETNDRLRRELLANVAHDLRTPLTSVRGYVELILRKQAVLTPAEQREYLQIVLHNATLERLGAELVELSQLEARQLLPQPAPFAVAELVQDVLANLQPVAQARTVHLEAHHPPDLPFACADAGMGQRVLQNLLDNALRYTPAGGRVLVRVAAAENARALRLEISDTGLGIAAADLPHVFSRHYRAGPGQPPWRQRAGAGYCPQNSGAARQRTARDEPAGPGRLLCVRAASLQRPTGKGLTSKSRPPYPPGWLLYSSRSDLRKRVGCGVAPYFATSIIE